MSETPDAPWKKALTRLYKPVTAGSILAEHSSPLPIKHNTLDMHMIHTALSKHSHNKHRIICAALRNAKTHSKFMQAAFLICSHTKAPTRKATTRSALLSLLHAAKHWTGLPAKRRAASAALHKLMKLSTPFLTHTERPTSPQMCRSPPFAHKPASPGNGVRNLYMAKFS
jgi:hypothetical protein